MRLRKEDWYGNYVTLDEAARLEGIKYNTLAHKVARNTNNKFTVKIEKNEIGGKDKVWVAVSSLSPKARKAYGQLRELQAQADIPGMAPETGTEEPWYVGVSLDWYIENYPEQYYRGVERGNVVRNFLEYDGKQRTQYAADCAQERMGKDQRTLYRHAKEYLKAGAWAARKAKEDGGNYDYYQILCLCRKPKPLNRHPSFRPEVEQLIRNIWFNRDFAANRGTKTMLYEKLQEVAGLNGWEKIPSYQSVVRYINWLMEDGAQYNAWYLASHGLREYKNRRMVKGVRDTSKLQVMEIVQGDEHTFDCWVAYTHPNGKVTAIRPKLVAWMDTRSRAILGDLMCRDASSEILKDSLLKLVTTVECVPKYLYIDNGKDYTAEVMIGRKRNDRGGDRHSLIDDGECFDIEFDPVARGFYKGLGIVDDHRAMPYQPWSKGQIERFFGGVCQRFSKWMRSYTGTLTGSLTDSKVNKDIKKMLERGELLTMDEFFEKWTWWLENKYMNHVHSQLKKLGEEHATPRSLFENGDRYYKPLPPKTQLTAIYKVAKKVRVYNTGIRMFGQYYMSAELGAYIDKTVTVKYDPRDITSIWVYNSKGDQLLEVPCRELLLFAPQVPQKAVEELRKEQNRQLRRDREILEENSIPFEEKFREINDRYVGFNPATGGTELMTGGRPKPAKVVSMPEDEAYRKNKQVRRPQEETQQDSKLLEMYAKRGLAKIRAMGEN